MSKQAFANAMNQIAAQSEAEQLRELAAERRRQFYAKVRGAIAAVLWLALFTSIFIYRVELQQFVSTTFFSPIHVGQIEGKTGEALKGIQAQADKRDQVLNEVAK